MTAFLYLVNPAFATHFSNGWTQPVHAGDSPTFDAEVVESKSSRARPDRGLVTMRNQKAEVVQKLLALVMMPRRAELA